MKVLKCDHPGCPEDTTQTQKKLYHIEASVVDAALNFTGERDSMDLCEDCWNAMKNSQHTMP